MRVSDPGRWIQARLLKRALVLELAFYAALSIVDLFITSLLLRYGGGSIYERNPIARAWLDLFGWPGLVAFKMLSAGLVAGVATLIAFYRPRLGVGILALGCVVMVAVVLYSVHLLDMIPS
jgi:Domain of unknown function (DUF5658)